MQSKLIKTDLVTCPGASGKVLVVWVAVEPDDFGMAMTYDICELSPTEYYYDWRGYLSEHYPDEQSCIAAAIENARQPIGKARGELLSTREVAERLGVSEGRVRQFVLQGRLTPVKKGRDLRFYEADLAAVSERRTGRPAGS